jgi:hypothetical protein
VIAPNNIRKATSTVGLNSRTPILIHRNDVLQIKPSKTNTIQCLSFIAAPEFLTFGLPGLVNLQFHQACPGERE